MKTISYTCDICQNAIAEGGRMAVRCKVDGENPLKADVCSKSCARRALIKYTNTIPSSGL